MPKNQNLSQIFNCLDGMPFNKYRTNDTNIYRRNRISTDDIILNNIDIFINY